MTDNPTQDTEQTTDQTEETRGPIESFIDYQKKALEETGKALETFLPDGFKEHSDAARDNFVKSFEVLAEAAREEFKRMGERMEEARQQASTESEEDKPSSTGATKVKVQVD